MNVGRLANESKSSAVWRIVRWNWSAKISFSNAANVLIFKLSSILSFPCFPLFPLIFFVFSHFNSYFSSLPHPRHPEILLEKLQANLELIPPCAPLHTLRALLQKHRLFAAEDPSASALRPVNHQSGGRVFRSGLSGQVDSENGVFIGVLGKVEAHWSEVHL